jgi:inosine-uridine nucleoside N-ribohydrolase
MLKKICLLLCLGTACANGFSQQVPVIFDSDMGPDYDDVGAITLLHSFADSGKVQILATMASDRYEGVAAVLNLFNTYFGRPEIPIGVPKGAAVDQDDWQHWTDTILAKYPHAVRRNEEAEDAVKLYRKILSGRRDNDVVIVTVGFLTNLAGLLRSGPDGYSPLNGLELVKKKVRGLVSMAGRMPAGREFNIWKDAEAARYVFSNWPTTVYFSGFEIGVNIKTGLPIVQDSTITHSPVKDVFRICLPLAEEDHQGRSSWDETAVLVACDGFGGYFDLHHGRIKIEADGSNTWEDSEKGGQAYLVPVKSFGEIAEVINRLMRHQPKRRK